MSEPFLMPLMKLEIESLEFGSVSIQNSIKVSLTKESLLSIQLATSGMIVGFLSLAKAERLLRGKTPFPSSRGLLTKSISFFSQNDLSFCKSWYLQI